MNAAQLPGRNNYIDCLRGIAAISIVFIHTCFWSGESYVPEFMQSLSLAIDVPFFFFLSGWASTYVNSFEKNIVSLLGIPDSRTNWVRCDQEAPLEGHPPGGGGGG